MSKAVLVMDISECCADCPCSFFERDNPILNLICGVTQEDAPGTAGEERTQNRRTWRKNVQSRI